MTSPFFCDLEALTRRQRERHRELALELRPLVTGFTELQDGYAAEFSSLQDLSSRIEEFLKLERLCCPFFELKMEKRNSDDVKHDYIVFITGSGEIKPFIRMEFQVPETTDRGVHRNE